uniref:Soil-associated protein, TIGR03435 family n=1 Tax=Solibacter usitatus (strain Ellin6076) TaxID=234267 RepID=Q01NA8_SOLUE
MRTAHVLLCATLAASAFGQQAAEVLEFEAASVKPNKSGSNHSESHGTPGQLVALNMSLRAYICRAFNVRDYQVSGPDWLGSEKFDIVAKYPPHSGDSQPGPRLQKLLADRFKLAIHRETKESPVYALLPAKNGPKIKPVEDKGDHSTNSERGKFVGTGVTMARFAEFLARYMDRPVVDLSDMKGVYNITLEWTPDEAGADASGPTLLTAIQQQLGLRLQPQKAPIEILVVDHAERIPVEN